MRDRTAVQLISFSDLHVVFGSAISAVPDEVIIANLKALCKIDVLEL